MNEKIKNLCAALDDLASFIRNAWNDDRTLKEVYGWHHPALTRHDLADFSLQLSKKLESINVELIDKTALVRLADVPRRLQLLKLDTIPYMFNGNGNQAVPAYTETIKWIYTLLDNSSDWQILHDNKAMPRQLAKRLQGLQADLETLIPDQKVLEDQIKLIQEATETLESLPADLRLLKGARATINKLSTEASEYTGKIAERANETVALIEDIANRKIEAEKLVSHCEEAYKITTTKGLAAAFDQRAIKLGWSMWFWVVGLLIALAIGASFGTKRIEILSTTIALADPKWGVICMHIILSLLSVAAPLWFAWLATKQIGQRFRLSEDYAFKASVAKAYEGYRKEAARIDSTLEARLFASALTRLEEAPLRLVEEATHGSPWHELISSKSFQSALEAAPELKDTFINICKEGMDKFGKIKNNNS